VLILAGIIIVVLFFTGSSTSDKPIQQKAAVESIIFADANKELNIADMSPENVVNNLRKEIGQTTLKLGSVENIVFTLTSSSTTELVSVKNFFQAINSSAQDGFVRSLDPNYMYGIHIFDKNNAFILLKTDSYEKTYSELLDWEKSYMYERLSKVLGVEPTQDKLTAKPFEDEVVKNVDARVLKDDDGNIIFMYAFLNRNYLVITTDEKTFYEVLARFTTPKPVVR
jgi:hypothetical protein